MTQRELDLHFMAQALELAEKAQALGEIPVGAVVVHDEQVIGQGFNQSISGHDPSAHAEIQSLRDAGRFRSNYRLTGSTLYVTLEPCVMCAGAILQARVQRVVFGAFDERYGAGGSRLNLLESGFLNHQCSVVSGVLKESCRQLLDQFFMDRRQGCIQRPSG